MSTVGIIRLSLSLGGLSLCGLSLWRMDTLNEAEQLWGYWPLWMWLGFGAFWSAGPLPWLLRHSPQRYRLIGLTALSGLLLFLSFMPQPFFPLAWLALLPLLEAERLVQAERGERSAAGPVFWLGLHSLLWWNILSTYWVLNSSLIAGIIANGLNALLQTIPWMLYYFVKRRHNEQVGDFALISFWIGFEYWHFNWDLSWPWLALGNSFGHLPWLVQWYEYTGIFGGSLWVLLSNVWLRRILADWRQAEKPNYLRSLLPLALLVWVLPIAWSVYRYQTYEPQGKREAEVVIVQPNYEPHHQKFSIPQFEQIPRFDSLARPLLDEGVAYLLFPETSFEGIEVSNLRENAIIAYWLNFLKTYPQLKLVMGLGSHQLYREADKLPQDRTALRKRCSQSGTCLHYEPHNSAIQLSLEQEEAEIPFYKKSKLVPGAESMPYIGNLEFFEDWILDLGGASGLSLGVQPQRAVFASRSGKVGPLICYESVYGEYVTEYVKRGAEALFVVTNDGWWDETAGHIQHLGFSRLRAIETRRDIARSANTGISCFVSQRGEVLQPTAYGEAKAIRGTIRLSTEKTIYVQYGDMLARILSFVAVALLLSALVKMIPGSSRQKLG